MSQILQRRTLIVGWQSGAQDPFIRVGEDEALSGLDFLLADTIARRWFGRPNTLAWVDDATLEDLNSGRIDLLMGGLAHTRAAEVEIDFSQTYWKLGDVPIAIGLPRDDSLLRDMVNATIQGMVDDGAWDDIVQAMVESGPTFTPERWQGEIPEAQVFASNSHSPTRDRLRPGSPLRIAFLSAPGFASQTNGDEPIGYLPDLGRELNRRLTGATEVTLLSLDTPPDFSFVTYDLYLGPQVHDWALEPIADFSETFYVDGLAMVARPGSNVNSIEQLNNRPTALVETDVSRRLYQAAITAAGVSPILFAVSDIDSAVALLEDNKVDAVLVRGYPTARLLAARIPEAILAPGRHGPTLPMAIVLPANDSHLRDSVNLALQDMLADGALADLHSRHFGGDPPYPIERWPLR